MLPYGTRNFDLSIGPRCSAQGGLRGASRVGCERQTGRFSATEGQGEGESVIRGRCGQGEGNEQEDRRAEGMYTAMSCPSVHD